MPHAVPSGSDPVSVQTACPVAQETVPVWQGFEGAHANPAVHATHTPAEHTKLVPHAVPSGSNAVSVQTGCPVEQETVPMWQGFEGAHDAPAVHATHTPAEHTKLVPHAVPFATAWPLSTHTGWPVEQEIVPEWHALAGLQLAPLVHAGWQTWLRQMWLAHWALLKQRRPALSKLSVTGCCVPSSIGLPPQPAAAPASIKRQSPNARHPRIRSITISSRKVESISRRLPQLAVPSLSLLHATRG